MRSIAAVTLLLCVAPCPQVLADGCCLSAVTPIETAVARYRSSSAERDGRAALSIAVTRDGDLLLAKGYGDAQPGLAADESTVYHIGSLTKQFTAAAILELIEQRAVVTRTGSELTLDTAASEIFSGVEHWRQDGSAVTVRRLLNMTSNLPNFTRRPPSGTDPWGAITAPTLLGELKKLMPWGWPDSFEYSNTSYFLLAEAVEGTALGSESRSLSFRDRLKATLFAEAGLSNTGFFGDYPPGSVVAAPNYGRQPVFIQPDWLKGSGDMASSAIDLHRWTKALMEGRVLRPEMRELMFSDSARVGPVKWYGMGWFVEHRQGRDVFAHSGTVPGYSGYILLVREPASSRWASVALLTNTDRAEGLDQLAEDLADAALE